MLQNAENTTSQPFERCIRSRVSVRHKVLRWFMSSIKISSHFQKTRPRVLCVLFYILATSQTLWLRYNSLPLAFTVGAGNWWSSKPSDSLTAAQACLHFDEMELVSDVSGVCFLPWVDGVIVVVDWASFWVLLFSNLSRVRAMGSLSLITFSWLFVSAGQLTALASQLWELGLWYHSPQLQKHTQGMLQDEMSNYFFCKP